MVRRQDRPNRPTALSTEDTLFLSRARRANPELNALFDGFAKTAKSTNIGTDNERQHYTLILTQGKHPARDWATEMSLLLQGFNIAYPSRAIEHSIHHDPEGDAIIIHGKEALMRLTRLGVEFPESKSFLELIGKDDKQQGRF